MKRRIFLFGLPTAALSAYGYAYHLEPQWLQETCKTVNLERPLRRPIRILHLSDLHASAEVPLSFIESAFRRGLALQPDLVCLTGDYVTTDTDFNPDRYRQVLQSLTGKVPVFASMGNHDGGEWASASGWFATSVYLRSLLSSAGVQVLHNSSTTLEVAGQILSIAGVGDWWSDEIDAVTALGSSIGDSVARLLLCHNPDGKDDCQAYRWDLMLSGHTHGGQIRVPFRGAPFVPILDKRYAEGLNRFENRWIHTTRGVGNVRGFRVNCRPEISLLILQ